MTNQKLQAALALLPPDAETKVNKQDVIGATFLATENAIEIQVSQVSVPPTPGGTGGFVHRELKKLEVPLSGIMKL